MSSYHFLLALCVDWQCLIVDKSISKRSIVLSRLLCAVDFWAHIRVEYVICDIDVCVVSLCFVSFRILAFNSRSSSIYRYHNFDWQMAENNSVTGSINFRPTHATFVCSLWFIKRLFLNYRMVNSNERFNFIQPIVLIVYAICREECSENVGTPTHGLTCRMSRKLHRYLRYAVALCVHQSNARSSSMCIVRPDVRLWTFHLGLLLHSLLMARICCRNSNVTCFANFGLHFVCGRTWKVTISTLHWRPLTIRNGLLCFFFIIFVRRKSLLVPHREYEWQQNSMLSRNGRPFDHHASNSGNTCYCDARAAFHYWKFSIWNASARMQKWTSLPWKIVVISSHSLMMQVRWAQATQHSVNPILVIWKVKTLFIPTATETFIIWLLTWSIRRMIIHNSSTNAISLCQPQSHPTTKHYYSQQKKNDVSLSPPAFGVNSFRYWGARHTTNRIITKPQECREK